MAASLLRYANREKVAQALTIGGYRVSRATVNRWARGDEMPEIAARMIAELFGHQHNKEAPPPTWATGLVEDVPTTKAGVEQLLIEVAALRAVLEARRTPLPQRRGGQVDDQGTDAQE